MRRASSPPQGNSLGFRLACLFLSAALAACSTTRPQYVWQDLGGGEPEEAVQDGASWGAAPEAADAPDPRIAPGFLLALSFPKDSAKDAEVRVGFDGKLVLPGGGTVAAGGATLSQLKIELADHFGSRSKVKVQVKERRRWVEVKGLVEKPGRVLVEPDASLDRLAALAGGTQKESPPQSARIQKGKENFTIDLNQYYGRGEEHPRVAGWLGGETVAFRKEPADPSEGGLSSPYRLPVFLLGEVRKPGEYPSMAGSDLLDFLVLANGFTDKADLERIEVVRRVGGRKRSFGFSWRNVEQAPAPVQGDVVIVHADQRTWEKRLTAATLLTSLLTSVVLILELEDD